MKNLFKKNQLMITALAVMIAIAGYLQFADKGFEGNEIKLDSDGIAKVNDVTGEIMENYTAEGIGEESYEDDLEVASEDILIDTLENIDSLDDESTEIADNYLNEDMTVETAAAVDESVDYSEENDTIPGEAVFTSSQTAVTVLSDAKLLKEQTRANNKETLLNIINSEGLTDTQKQAAVDSMVKMTGYAEQEASIEILLSAKGFSDAVVSVSDEGVDVVVNALELSDTQRAQITDIVMRKTAYDANNIVISAIVE